MAAPVHAEFHMEVQLTSTTKIVEVNGVPARVWEGMSASGIKCHAYITRIAVEDSQDTSEFETELQEHVPPSAEVAAIPLSLVW